jgi:hypothetical protein
MSVTGQQEPASLGIDPPCPLSSCLRLYAPPDCAGRSPLRTWTALSGAPQAHTLCQDRRSACPHTPPGSSPESCPRCGLRAWAAAPGSTWPGTGQRSAAGQRKAGVEAPCPRAGQGHTCGRQQGVTSSREQATQQYVVSVLVAIMHYIRIAGVEWKAGTGGPYAPSCCWPRTPLPPSWSALTSSGLKVDILTPLTR